MKCKILGHKLNHRLQSQEGMGVCTRCNEIYWLPDALEYIVRGVGLLVIIATLFIGYKSFGHDADFRVKHHFEDLAEMLAFITVDEEHKYKVHLYPTCTDCEYTVEVFAVSPEGLMSCEDKTVLQRIDLNGNGYVDGYDLSGVLSRIGEEVK